MSDKTRQNKERRIRERPKPRSKEAEHEQGRDFPTGATVLTILSIIFGLVMWYFWAQVSPILPYLGELMNMSSGGGSGGGGEPDPALLALVQGLDPEALVFQAIIFWIFLTLFVSCGFAMIYKWFSYAFSKPKGDG
jgi:hypothetical protein